MLGFRDVWAFVGQKGIKGFTPLEEVLRSIIISLFIKDIAQTHGTWVVHGARTELNKFELFVIFHLCGRICTQ